LPQEKVVQWQLEMQRWLQQHPEPHDAYVRQEFYNRFPASLQRWIDAGYGSCILEICAVRELVEKAIRHFQGERYSLDAFVVASNHVHVLVTPLVDHQLSKILHSWKSFTAHQILKLEATSRRLAAAQGNRKSANYKVAAASRR
jgi:REP element-mobilizing transposase RayT